MSNRVYITVASFCLVEAIEKLKQDGCIEFGISKQDESWLLSFNLPCKRPSVANDNGTIPEKDMPPVDDKGYVFPNNEKLDVELFPDAERQIHRLYKQEQIDDR